MGIETQPSVYLSVVMAGRNDDYGGDFLARMQRGLWSWAYLQRRATYAVEVLVVDWNPPKGKPGLADALHALHDPALPGCRVVQVPESVHCRYSNPGGISLLEYEAKNAGLRRARGEFVVCTNPDVMASAALTEWLASATLDADCYYRANRHDVAAPIPQTSDLPGVLRFCARHTYRIAAPGGFVPAGRIPGLLRHTRGTYRLARMVLGALRRQFTGRDAPRISSLLGRGGVHGCAAGDFLLMHRERWAAVRGYPPVVGIGGVDEYPCYIAMRLGIRQVVLRYPRVVFHQDHARTGRSKVTVTDKAALRESFRRVLGGDLTVLGPEDWGLAGVRLAETSVGRC